MGEICDICGDVGSKKRSPCPARDSSWTGRFQIHGRIKNVDSCFKAHPRFKVHPRVVEILSRMPKILQFELVDREMVWTELFQDKFHGEDDIGLYFFPAESKRSDYKYLLAYIEAYESAMRCNISGVELFLFSSKGLFTDSKNYYLWGVFRKLEEYKSESTLYEQSVVCHQPLDPAENNDIDNNDDRDVELRKLKQKRKYVDLSAEEGERRYDFAREADPKDGAIPETDTAKLNENSEENMMIETVGPDQIADVMSPVTRPGPNDKERVVGLAERLQQRVVGQDHAVRAVADVVLNSRAGLARPKKPAGTFLFLGPNGVGKTELAKALAEQVLDDEKFLVRIDLSECMGQQLVAQLFGALPAYVGDEEGGELNEAVKSRPYSVLLFPEVEKAHPTVFTTLLQVLEGGRLTDGKGGTVDFTNTVIIMTSNLGARYLLEGSMEKCTMESAREHVMQEMKKHFKSGLLSLLDDILIFEPLKPEELRKVARLQMKDIASSLANRSVSLGVTEAALDIILAESYVQESKNKIMVYGARLIRRWLDRNVITVLSEMLIRGEIDKNSTVYIDAMYDRKELTYRVEKNGGIVNAATRLNSDILIQVPNEPGSNAAQVVKKTRTKK